MKKRIIITESQFNKIDLINKIDGRYKDLIDLYNKIEDFIKEIDNVIDRYDDYSDVDIIIKMYIDHLDSYFEIFAKKYSKLIRYIKSGLVDNDLGDDKLKVIEEDAVFLFNDIKEKIFDKIDELKKRLDKDV